MKGVLILFAGILLTGAASSAPAHVVEVTGNGRITAGMDGAGRLIQLRWPTLGYWEHLAPEAADATTPGGAGWRLSTGAGAHPFTDGPWQIDQHRNADGSVTTTYTDESGGRQAVQRLTVLNDVDVLVVQLEIVGFPPDTRVYWSQWLRPSTHLPTGFPDGYHRFPQSTGFVTAYDPVDGTLLAFRPRHPGKEDWSRARHLATTVRSSTVWTSFGSGVYWGTFSPSGALGGNVVPARRETAAFPVPVKGDGHVGVTGRAHGVLEPALEAISPGRYGVTVYLAVAETEGALQVLRTRTLEMRPMARAGSPPTTHDEAGVSALETLLACFDSATGSVLRAPVSYPALAHATVFNTAWATAALDQEGLTVPAQRALAFHRATLRTTFGVDGLPGSLPARVHSTGQPAQFLDGANPSSTAWLLAALWRHVAGLEPERALAGLEEWDEALELGGDFLSRAPVVGAVLSGTMGPQAASLAELQTHYLGLVSARLLRERQGKTEPIHWQQRREETYARIRFRQLDGAVDAESRWLDAWVRALPDEARVQGNVWDILRIPEASPVRLPSELEELDAGVPVALRAALSLLGITYTY